MNSQYFYCHVKYLRYQHRVTCHWGSLGITGSHDSKHFSRYLTWPYQLLSRRP